MNVGDTIDRDQARQLPVGAKFTDTDGSRPRTVTNGGYVRDGQGYQREWAGLPTRNFTITHLPAGTEGFTIGQRVDQDVVRRLPTGAVWQGEDGRERTIIEQGRRYRDPAGVNAAIAAWRGRNGQLVSLPDATRPKPGDVIAHGDHEALRALPDGSEVEVIGNQHRYVKSGDNMEQVGGDGAVVEIRFFSAEVTITWMPGQKKQAYTKHAVGQTGIDGRELRDLPVGAVVRGDNDERERRIVKEGYRIEAGPRAGEVRPIENMTGPYTLVSLPDTQPTHGFTIGQQIPAAELHGLPVGTLFTGGDGVERLTTEGGNYVIPADGIVRGGGEAALGGLAGTFTIKALPEHAETLAEFKARVWRVTRPYAADPYTRDRTNMLMDRLGIREPEVEDPNAVQEFKDRMWNEIAGEARNQGWCATWKKPLAELGITEPKPKTVTTTITISHDPTQADVEHLRGHVTGLAGVESVEVS